jgi:hypothetical protein
MKYLILLTSLAVSTPSAAAPTYLQCSFPESTAKVDITADEPNSSVTISLPSTGYIEKVAASFTPEEVRFETRLLSYVVSRTDLTVKRNVPSLRRSETGKCELVAAPKRAF